MNKINEYYANITKEREKVIGQLEALERKNIVMEYNNLRAKNRDLLTKQRKMENYLEYKKYDDCNHLLITYYNDWEVGYYGCIKCGLHHDVLFSNDKTMYTYLNNGDNLKKFWSSKRLNIVCDLELANAIYKKIIESHPDIDDETLIKYFNNAVNHIKNKEVSEERKIDRAKRLQLKNNFFNFHN